MLHRCVAIVSQSLTTSSKSRPPSRSSAADPARRLREDLTINYQFGDVDAHGAMIRALARVLEAEHRAIISDVLTAVKLLEAAPVRRPAEGSLPRLGRISGDLQAAWAEGAELPATTWHKPTAPSAQLDFLGP